MTILKEGEKFACKQCIQGHRVSTCHHEERPLIHVARKGRPVSQCLHCRGLRKVRQTHIKCDCGERRHSRTTSSESNTIYASDESPCQCGPGRQCVCGLRKDRSFDLGHVALSSDATPVVRKPMPTGRRSASAVPRSRNSYLPSMPKTLVAGGDYGVQYSSASTSRRSYHHAQRSADNIPLILESSAPLDLPALRASSGQFLSPSPMVHSMPQRSASDHLLAVNEGLRHFNVPLDDDVLARALSPQNPKRYSMNDWSMLTFNGADDQQQQQQQHSTHLGGGSMGHQHHHSQQYQHQRLSDGGFPFPSNPQQHQQPQWHHEEWSGNVSSSPSLHIPHGTPPMHAAPRFTHPNFSLDTGLSSSSTLTVSDFSDSSWQQQQQQLHDDRRSSSFASVAATAPSPLGLELSSSSGGSRPLSYHDLGNGSGAATNWASASSYPDTVSEYSYAPSDSFPPASGGSGVAAQQQQQQLGGYCESPHMHGSGSNTFEPVDFVFPGSQMRESPQLDSLAYAGLPDRSVPSWSTSPPHDEPSMNAAFKFPADDLYFAQSYAETHAADGKEWLGDDAQYLELVDSESPLAQ